MTYISIAGFIFVFALSAFGFNYRLSSINRVYFGLYKGLAENSVLTVDENGRDLDKPYFCRTLFIRNLEVYLDSNEVPMAKTRYELLTIDERKTTTTAEYAVKAIINLHFELTFSKDYEKTAVFTIKQGELEA